jgi:two-component system, OmpR family, heavy metal sensor histidine kinase CusS
MGAMLAAMTLLAAVGARWAARDTVRRGLAPLDQLGQQLAGIEPSTLGGRLNLAQPVGELQPWIDHFNALLTRLEQAYRQLENFNADVAHELRTPLNNLLGQTEVALSRPRTAAQLHETLASNLEELQRLGGLVQDMLFLSRADRGAQARREMPLSLAQLAREVVEFHEAAIDERGLRVALFGDARLAVDAGLLRRAISNLLSNAARHATPQTVVEIRIAVPDASGSMPGAGATLAVVNRGTGIAPEHLPRIFDRFFRADPSRQASDVNHGLGLAIVAAIARMHGGVPIAQSAEGQTTVGLTIASMRWTKTDSSVNSSSSSSVRAIDDARTVGHRLTPGSAPARASAR